ncbi:hypothetical protein DSECCO2_443050 [anaerobic digester metagenome]
MVDGIEGQAAGDEGSTGCHQLLQGALYSVINSSNKSGCKLDGQAHTASIDIVARANTGGILIDLNRRQPIIEFDHFSDQLLLADSHQFHHHGILDILDNENRSVYSLDASNNSLFHVCS